MIDDSESHAPVVQWSTICFFIICSIHLGWTTRSVDWVDMFPKAPPDKPMFMSTPRGFMNKCGEDRCLKVAQMNKTRNLMLHPVKNDHCSIIA